MVDDAFPRLFLALWPHAAVRSALARCRDAWDWSPGALPEASARLHLTLHFIGKVARERVPDVAGGLGPVALEPFALRLDTLQRWPNGIAVLTPMAVPPPLRDLHRALGADLEGLGLPTEARPYRPHVTLARRAGDSAAPAGVPAVDWTVNGFVLVASEPATRAYRVLQRYG